MTPKSPSTDGVITFPDGLPGFETFRRFVLIASPAFDPFTCVHGLEEAAPSFLAIDPRRVAPDFSCPLEPADRARLKAGDTGLLVWLAIVSADAERATVNLRAPLVVNPDTMLGVQVVAAGSPYPIDHPLTGV